MNNKIGDPLVSIIIPTYNRESLILRAIQSLDDQTFQDFEIFIVDDASTDSTEKVIKKLAHPKINFIRLNENKGQCYARNLAIKQSRSKYIGFLDSDDEWLPTKLEKQVRLFEKSNDRLGAVYCGFIEKDEVQNEERIINRDNLRGDLYKPLLGGFCPSTPTMFLVKRQALIDVDFFDEKLPTFVDLDLWLSIAKKGYTFDYVDEPLIIKYEHEGEQIAKNLDMRIRGLDAFSEKWGSEMVKNTGEKSYTKFKKYKVFVVIKALLENLPKNYRKDVLRSILLMFKYRIVNFKMYAKIFLVLIFGKGILSRSKE